MISIVPFLSTTLTSAPPPPGFMADVTQSYSISMCILGGMAALGLTSWFFMGVAERVDRRREEAKTLRKALQKT